MVLNGILEDVRNFHNFRATFSEFRTSKNSRTIINDGYNLFDRPEQIEFGRSPSKSYYMSANDFLFTDKIQISKNSNDITPIYGTETAIQPIILNEFQPDSTVWNTSYISFALETAATFIPGARDLINFASSTVQAGAKTGAFANTSKTWANYLLSDFSIMPENLYGLNATGNKKNNPMHWIYTLFESGRWLNTYELPFFSDVYLQGNQYNNWSVGRS